MLDEILEIARSHASSQAQLTAMAAETADGSIYLAHPPPNQPSPSFKPPRGLWELWSPSTHQTMDSRHQRLGRFCSSDILRVYCFLIRHCSKFNTWDTRV